MAPLTPDEVLRNYNTDGVPSSGIHNPIKAELIQLFEQIESEASTALQVANAASEFVTSNVSSIVSSVVSRAELKALTPSAGNAATMTESIREGTFVWRAGDHSSVLLGNSLASSAVNSGTAP